MLVGDVLNRQGPGELEGENAFGSSFRSQTHGGGGFQRIVSRNGRLYGVVHRVEGCRMNRGIREAMRGPNIIIGFRTNFVELTEEERLIMLCIKRNIKGASGYALDVGVKTGLSVCRKVIRENPKGVAGVKLS